MGLIVGTGVSFPLSQIVLLSWGLTPAFTSVGVSVGLLVGIAQWIALKVQFRQAGWWILASTAGYALGLLAAVNAPVAIPVGGAIIFGPEFGGLIGAVSGVFTGITLVWLLKRPMVATETPGTTTASI